MRIARGAVLLIALVAGCVGKEPKFTSQYDNSPSLPLDAVLRSVNANAGRITTVVAEGRFDASLRNGDKFEPLFGGITILHTKPNQIRVVADAGIVGQDAFDLGSNGRTYWMSAFGKVDTTWYGTPRGTTEISDRLPIPAPELLVDVLGIATLSVDLLAQPVPTMRYNPDYHCYMLTWHQPMTDRWVTVREVWYDRYTFLPTRVLLFDRDGRAMVRAKLDDFRPIELADGPLPDGQQPPVMAHKFDLLLPETGSTMKFTLDEARDRRRGAPNRLSYRFSLDTINTSKVVDLDRETPAGGSPAPVPQPPKESGLH